MELTRENQHKWDEAQIRAEEAHTKECKNGGACVFNSFKEMNDFMNKYKNECENGYGPFLKTLEGQKAFNDFVNEYRKDA